MPVNKENRNYNEESDKKIIVQLILSTARVNLDNNIHLMNKNDFY